MSQDVRNLALFGATVIVLSFVVFVVNQTAQVVQLASTFDPGAGKLVLTGLTGAYVVLLAVPVFLVLRLPRPLVPPASREGPEFSSTSTGCVIARLRAIRHQIAGLEGEAAVERAIERLDEEAERIVRATASQVFVSTAVSQSGRLDTFLVLSLQTRMVWKLARLYYQRPSLRDMSLYATWPARRSLRGSSRPRPRGADRAGLLGGDRRDRGSGSGLSARGVDPGQFGPERRGGRVLDLVGGDDHERYCGALVVEPPASSGGRPPRKRPSTSVRSWPRDGRVMRALWSDSRGKVGDAAKEAYSKLLRSSIT